MELRERHNGVPLKDKLQLHYHARDFSPKKKDVNRMGIMFFWGMTLSLLLESQIILIPHLYAGDWIKIGLMILLVWFTFFESTINWAGVFFSEVNNADVDLKKKHFPDTTDTPPDWIYCAACQVDAPPRSFHCSHCNVCVLKRDHHCLLTNSCVGFYNQRFFVLFCFYMIWGNGFALFLQLNYLNETLPLNSWEFLTYLPMVTIFKFLFGYISFFQFFLVTHAVFCFFCFISALFFFWFQISLIARGMTSFEVWKVRSIYGEKTILENFHTVFGSVKYIPLQLLLPFKIDQKGDGAEWTINREKSS